MDPKAREKLYDRVHAARTDSYTTRTTTNRNFSEQRQDMTTNPGDRNVAVGTSSNEPADMKVAGGLQTTNEKTREEVGAILSRGHNDLAMIAQAKFGTGTVAAAASEEGGTQFDAKYETKSTMAVQETELVVPALESQCEFACGDHGDSSSSDDSTGEDGHADHRLLNTTDSMNNRILNSIQEMPGPPTELDAARRESIRSSVGAFNIPGVHFAGSEDDTISENRYQEGSSTMLPEPSQQDHVDIEAPGTSATDTASVRMVEATLVTENNETGSNTNMIMAEAQPLKSTVYCQWVSVAGILLMVVLVLVVVTIAIPQGGQETSADSTFVSVPPTSFPSDMEPPFQQEDTLPTLRRIQQERVLRCGVLEPRHSNYFQKPQVLERQIDAAYCHAVAAAAMAGGGDNYRVELIPTPLPDRAEMIGNRTVDLMITAFSVTMDRDILPTSPNHPGMSFSTPYHYLVAAFGGWSKHLACAQQLQPGQVLMEKEECADLSVCVMEGTRYWDLLGLMLPKNQLSAHTSMMAVVDAFVANDCNVMVAPWVEFNVLKHNIEDSGKSTEDFVVDGIFSFEPFSFATRDDDQQFTDFVFWVFQAMIVAEHLGMTHANMNDGTYNGPSFQQTTAFGEATKDMFFNAVAAEGNWGELLERHKPDIMPRKQMNFVNNGTTGIINSLPLGQTSLAGPDASHEGTFAHILERGRLRCAVRGKRPGFALRMSNHNATWHGMDVDFCRSISAAIFAEVLLDVVEVQSDHEGFLLLQEGIVDLFAGVMVTMERNVLEPSTGNGYGFSRPYYYNESAILSSESSKGGVDLNLCLATKKEDILWSKFVMWLVEGIFYAEENGITELTSNYMPIVALFGPAFQRMFRDAILAVGNYGAIYERNVAAHVPRSGLNLLYDKDNPGPLQFPLPGLLE